jgi:hypothetical protein
VAPDGFNGLGPFVKHAIYVPMAMLARIMNAGTPNPLEDRALRVLTVKGGLASGSTTATASPRYARNCAAWTKRSSLNRAATGPRTKNTRDRLREELTLAELELSEAQVEQFDIGSALAKAISVLNNAAALWIDASLDDRLRLQERLNDQPSRRMRSMDGVQTPPNSLTSNELRRESRSELSIGTGTGIRTPVPWLRTTCPDP